MTEEDAVRAPHRGHKAGWLNQAPRSAIEQEDHPPEHPARASIRVAPRRRIEGRSNKGRGAAGKEGEFGTPLKPPFPCAKQIDEA